MTDARDDSTTRAASYAVGALTDAERRELEQELLRSPRLAAEVGEFTETAAMLGLATAPVAPPASMRAQLLDAVEATPQPSNVVRGPWFSRPVAVLLGAAAAAVIAVGGTAITLQATREPSVVEQITAAADYERAVGEVPGGGSVTAVWSPSLGRAAVVVDDLAELPSDRVYQAWLIDDTGYAAPDATLGSGGTRTLSVSLVGEMEEGAAIGITVEPAGGSEIPTTTPILVIPTA